MVIFLHFQNFTVLQISRIVTLTRCAETSCGMVNKECGQQRMPVITVLH